jgi:shikimate 5-dehydrogenase
MNLTNPLLMTEITDRPWESRWTKFKEIAKREFNLAVEVNCVEASHETFPAKLKEILKSESQVCVVAQSFSVEVLKHLPQLTAEAIQMGATDVIIKDKGGWWPRPCLDEAFTRAIFQRMGQINFDSHALVAGANGYSKMIIGALAKIGFLNINLIEQSEEIGNNILEEMKKKYFQINFNFIGLEKVTKLPGVHSVLMNTIPLTLEDEILDELYFFNFLDQKGVVMDLNLPPSDTPLVLEAKQWGARHLSGDYFFSERDLLILQKARGLALKKGTSEEYRLLLRGMVETWTFDPAPYLKRFRDRGT